mmetsp:Transcript_65028/g.121138  ORF Transcript_65028/g.121138 Transcript_65028/m.121138 type:complete len:165 (-) Transcript_65028:36-530(-)
MKLTPVLTLAIAIVCSDAVVRRTAPDPSKQVMEEGEQNIHISDGFLAQEEQDEEVEKKVRSDHDLNALQVSATAPSIVDPCKNLECGLLSCPGGFKAEAVPGHCCPYCVNPDIKLEAAVTGATGKSGGFASTFCKEVWCFPTMCTEPMTEPNDSNGLCCPVCPK